MDGEKSRAVSECHVTYKKVVENRTENANKYRSVSNTVNSTKSWQQIMCVRLVSVE